MQPNSFSADILALGADNRSVAVWTMNDVSEVGGPLDTVGVSDLTKKCHYPLCCHAGYATTTSANY